MIIIETFVFRLPKEICENINRILLAKFWWGSWDRTGLLWYVWKRVCKPKRKGGLGFRDIESFNQTLLGKQVRCILQAPNYLMARILKVRYFSDLDHHSQAPSPSNSLHLLERAKCKDLSEWIFVRGSYISLGESDNAGQSVIFPSSSWRLCFYSKLLFCFSVPPL